MDSLSSNGVSVSRCTRLQLSPFAYGAVTLSRHPFQNVRLGLVRCGLLRFRSPLLAEWSLFLEVLRCFSSLSSLARGYVFTTPCAGMPLHGFPHSETSDSPAAHASSELFAVYRVLHRHLTPSHSPYALVALPCVAEKLSLSRVCVRLAT